MVPPDPVTVDPAAGFDSLPQTAAVYLIRAGAGQPWLGRTSVLRRRICRIFTRWQLGGVATRIEYWPTASRLEQGLIAWAVARREFPTDYGRVVRLARPAYLKLVLTNRYPRPQITTRLSGTRSPYFGPFPARAAAEAFAEQVLDLFQLRRCQEDLEPGPEHPGCIYGEMRRCLRPCQEAVTEEEYRSEARRVELFLVSRGESLREATALARDRASAALDFEEAARLHALVARIGEVMRGAGELAREISQLNGVAVTRAVTPEAVGLWFLRGGAWIEPRVFSLKEGEGPAAPLDRRLRELVATLPLPCPAPPERQEHLALLSQWYYSSWRDGEWLGIDRWEAPPYRKLVNAIHRVLRGGSS